MVRLFGNLWGCLGQNLDKGFILFSSVEVDLETGLGVGAQD